MVINFDDGMIVSYETMRDTGVKITVRNNNENDEIMFAVTHGEICLVKNGQFFGGYTFRSPISWLADLKCGEDHPTAEFIKRLVNHEIRAYEKGE